MKINENEKLIDLSNEKLVDLIQTTNEDIYWETLFIKTEACIFKVFHKKIHKYYKETMKDDMLSLLKVGWTKAVVKYDKNRATSSFIAWASTLMEQEYIGYVKKIKDYRDGSSVRAEYLDSIRTNNYKCPDDTDKSISGCIVNVLEDKRSQDDFSRIELKSLINQKLILLKKYYPISHQIIVDNIFLCKTQNEIANVCGLKQTSVSRYMKLGKQFLKDSITQEEKDTCF